jgi:hypothetical protein
MKNIIQADNGDSFAPTGTVTRAEAAEMLHRFVENVVGTAQ